MLLVVPAVTIALGLVLAVLVTFGGRRGTAIRGASSYRIAYFFPQLLSLPIIALLWQFVYHPNDGLLNGLLRGIGLDGLARTWLGDPHLALWAVMAVMIWSSVGFYMVLFAAAMGSIPTELIEAATHRRRRTAGHPVADRAAAVARHRPGRVRLPRCRSRSTGSRSCR